MAKSKRIVAETPEQETMAEAGLPGRSPRQRLSARLGADRVFYGWYMVMAGSASNFFTAGIVIYGIGVLYEPMRRELGWSMAALTAGASVRSFEQGFMAPVAGYLTDRFGPRVMERAHHSRGRAGYVLPSSRTLVLLRLCGGHRFRLQHGGNGSVRRGDHELV